jgi:ribose-phosphate pyrophosphokinase
MKRVKPEVASPFVIVSSPGMHEMGDSIRDILEHEGMSFPHYRLEYVRFANGEILPRIPETVRRQHVFFLHPLQHPDPNTAVMMLLLANDALKRASTAGITLVVPYIPYLRQDRKDKPRVPISARLIADLIESNGAVERLITVDMHAEQEQGFFSIPVDNLTSMPIFEEYFRDELQEKGRKVVVVAPDFGAAVRARRFAGRLGDVPVSIVEKRRPSPNVTEIVSIIGEPVAGASVVIFDDMIDTGGTIRNTALALRNMGAAEVYLSATHGIFSGGATEAFAEAGLRVATTDSIPRDDAFRREHRSWLTTVSIDRLLASAILEASSVGGSVSKLSL